jgi:hypothetical protein
MEQVPDMFRHADSAMSDEKKRVALRRCSTDLAAHVPFLYLSTNSDELTSGTRLRMPHSSVLLELPLIEGVSRRQIFMWKERAELYLREAGWRAAVRAQQTGSFVYRVRVQLFLSSREITTSTARALAAFMFMFNISKKKRNRKEKCVGR